LEASIIDNKVEDYFKVLSIRLLAVIKDLFRLDDWANSTIGVRPLAIGEVHIVSLLQMTAAESSRDGKYGNLKFMLRCQAKGNSNRDGINDWRCDMIVIFWLLLSSPTN